MAGIERKRGTVGICLFLALTTLLLYLPATRNGFVSLDDHDYIIDNPHVTTGLTASNVAWAFRFTGYASNWHPLTWIAHMVDYEVYGLNAGGHHLTSVLFHIADSVLVFLLFQQMTGSRWRSAFVAALFAWHPLHVESVAWASELKDVLSTFFWLLTTMAYVKYVHEFNPESRPSGPLRGVQPRVKALGAASRSSKFKVYYLLALVLFALGLMSKPMLVTLPFTLLLLDFWPLRRSPKSKVQSPKVPSDEHRAPGLIAVSANKNGGAVESLEAQLPDTSVSWLRLVVEKLPFFALAAAACVITYETQHHAGATSSLEEVTLPRRLANAALAYLRYAEKTAWPSGLAAFYPYPRHQSLALILAGVGFVVIASVVCLVAARRRPFLFTGWFWFLGTLVPTIGLVQVGSQAMADRYMYIPSLGLFAMLVWGLCDFLSACTSEKGGQALATCAGAVALGCCAVFTTLQIGTWHDSERLYRNAIAVTKNNYVAYNGLGQALDDAGKPDEALVCYRTAVEMDPRYPEGQYNLGTALLNKGQVDEAIGHFQAALKENPHYEDALNNLGKADLLKGRTEDAEGEFKQAIASRPGYAQAYYNLGTLYVHEGRLPEAVDEFTRAIDNKPDYFDAYGNLGVTYMELNRASNGIAALTMAAQLRPDDAATRSNLGLALLNVGRLDDAAQQFSEALRVDPSDPKTHFNLAVTLARQRKMKEAVGHYRAALGLKPDYAEALINLAWILATDKDADLRDGHEAEQLAQKACELSSYKQAGPMLTLAAADAEAGDYTGAAATVTKAHDLAVAAGDKGTAAEADKMLVLFQAGLPYRELR